jgi:hypothetical protein
VTTVSNQRGGGAAHRSATLTQRAARQADRAHGVALVARVVEHDEAADLLLRAAWLRGVRLDSGAAADAERIATGASAPFPIALTLTATAHVELGGLEEVAAVDAEGRRIGVIAIDARHADGDGFALEGRITLALARRGL